MTQRQILEIRRGSEPFLLPSLEPLDMLMAEFFFLPLVLISVGGQKCERDGWRCRRVEGDEYGGGEGKEVSPAAAIRWRAGGHPCSTPQRPERFVKFLPGVSLVQSIFSVVQTEHTRR